MADSEVDSPNFLQSDDTLPSNCMKKFLYLSETNLQRRMKISNSRDQAVDIKENGNWLGV